MASLIVDASIFKGVCMYIIMIYRYIISISLLSVDEVCSFFHPFYSLILHLKTMNAIILIIHL